MSTEQAYSIADKLKITPSALSRAAAGLLRKKSVFSRAAEYLSKQMSCAIDADLLTVELTPKEIVAAALWLRTQRLSPKAEASR